MGTRFSGATARVARWAGAVAAALVVCLGTVLGVVDPSSASATSGSLNPFRGEMSAAHAADPDAESTRPR